MDKKIRVGITSIGGGVGQSAIDSCRLSKIPLYTIGLGASPMAFGGYDCDIQDILPNIYSNDYINKLIAQCIKHKIEVLVPGLDDELYGISKNIEKFNEIGVTPIVASTEVINLCRDKVKMSQELNKISNVFVNSYDKQSLIDEYRKNDIQFPLIAKPRSGFSSNGLIVINSEDDFQLINEEHVIQEIAMPHDEDSNYESYIKNLNKGIIAQVSEVSVQFVVGKRGNIIGKSATYNKLKNGIPIEIIPYENHEVWTSLEDIIKYLIKIGLRGPINIQGRMTNKGLKFFEMNARFTGITGLRAIMGFNEVEALIKDFSDSEIPINELKLNTKRVGIRQVSNRVIEQGRNVELDKMVAKTGYRNWLRQRKAVLVTGATGFLGREIVQQLNQRNDVERIVCLVRDRNKAESVLSKNNKVEIYTIEDVEKGMLSFGSVDVLIHCAFALIDDGFEAIAKSLNFSNWILTTAYHYHIPAVINISSQSVYGLTRIPLWDECLNSAPETPYGQAKWATELTTSNISLSNNQIRTTSIRLSRIFGPGLRSNELPYKFSKLALKNEDIVIQGGTQNLDMLDVRDAASGVISLMDLSPTKWKEVYNIGSGSPINIKDIAKTVNTAASTLEKKGSRIIIKPREINLSFGMAIKRINDDTGWQPKIKPEKTFMDIMNWLIKEEEG